MKQLMITVLGFLSLKAFAKDKDGKMILTEEQQTKLKENFGEQFTSKFLEGLAKESGGESLDDTATNAMISDLQSQLQTTLKEKTELQNTLTAERTEKERLSGVVTSQKKALETLSMKPEDEPPAGGKGSSDPIAWVPNGRDTHLFGQNNSFFAIDDSHPYNQRAYAKMMQRQGVVVLYPEGTSSMDYASLKTDLGEYYRVRKSDRIQSFLVGLPSLESLFNLESGYQDQAALVNVFLTEEFSQADSTALGSAFDNMVKGGFKFEAEVITMYDVMFAHKFTQLKELEKNWMGYLNREASNPIKMSFIEFILVEVAKKLKNEQEIRRIRGIRKNPIVNVPGTALGAANGLLKFIKNQIAAFKLRPFAIGEWTDSTIANYVYTATGMVPEAIRDTGMVELYMSTDAVSKYHSNLETLYGGNTDYKADIMYVKQYPNVKIVPIPNMGSSKRMIWTIKGNISLFEDKPGEMLSFQLEQQDWSLKVWSNWKESTWAYMVGRKYDSAAAVPEDYSTQMIFCNDVDEPENYFTAMDANDTTPSVANHTSLISVANTQATAITNIDDCAVGQQVILKCGSATNAITIAKSGNFSIISAAWTPALGDTITLKKRSDGKFIEINRSNATSDAIAIAADDATPSVADGREFITNANTQATAITNLDDAVTGVVYKINGAGSTNASTIANSGNFVLTAAMTLSAGAWIELEKSAIDGKFYEIRRSA